MGKRFSISSAIFASVLATIAMTIVMLFFGIDIMKSLGVIAGMKGSSAYFIGGAIHLIAGVVYGLIYALIFEPLFKKIPGFIAGGIYSLLPFILSLTMFGTFKEVIRSVFHADNTQAICEPAYQANKESPCEYYPTHKAEPMLDIEDSVELESDRNKQVKNNSSGMDDNEETSSSKERLSQIPDRAGERALQSDPCAPPCQKKKKSCPPNPCDDHQQKFGQSMGDQGSQMRSPTNFEEQSGLQDSQEQDDYQQLPKDSELKSQEAAAASEFNSDHSQQKGGSWLYNLINHLVYGIVLGLVYRPRKNAGQ